MPLCEAATSYTDRKSNKCEEVGTILLFHYTAVCSYLAWSCASNSVLWMSISFCIFSTTRVSRAAAAAGQGIEVSPSSPCLPRPADGEEELAEPPPPERAPVPAVAAGTATSIRCKRLAPLHPRRDPQAALLVDMMTLAALLLDEQVIANKSTRRLSAAADSRAQLAAKRRIYHPARPPTSVGKQDEEVFW